MSVSVEVIGLVQINRALAQAGPLIYRAARQGMREAAEPVRKEAGVLSVAELSGMKRTKPNTWQVQKVGVKQAEVYLVPKMKGKRRGRTAADAKRAYKFVELMMGKSYEPALEHNKARVRLAVDTTLGKAIREL